MRLYLVKASGGYLIPASRQDRDEIDEKLHNGAVYRAEVVKERNSRFHRKVLSLLRYAFDNWTPEPVEGLAMPPIKDFDNFREQITIAAGYGYPVFNPDGSFVMKAESISFANMEEIKFEDLFSSYVDTLLAGVLKGHAREDIDSFVNTILGYAG